MSVGVRLCEPVFNAMQQVRSIESEGFPLPTAATHLECAKGSPIHLVCVALATMPTTNKSSDKRVYYISSSGGGGGEGTENSLCKGTPSAIIQTRVPSDQWSENNLPVSARTHKPLVKWRRFPFSCATRVSCCHLFQRSRTHCCIPCII